MASKGGKSRGKLHNYRKSAKSIIDRAVKAGFHNDIFDAFGTFHVEDLIKKKSDLENLKRKIKNIRDREKRKKEEEKRKEKLERYKLIKEGQELSRKQRKEIKDEYGQKVFDAVKWDATYGKLDIFRRWNAKDSTIADLKVAVNNIKLVSGKTHAKNLMNQKIDRFFDNYFLELSNNDKDIPKIQELKDFFYEEENLSSLYDFMYEVTTPDFRNSYNSDKAIRYQDVDGYEGEIRRRLNACINLIKTKYAK